MLLTFLFHCSFTGTVRRFLEKFGDTIDTVIFVVTDEDEVRTVFLTHDPECKPGSFCLSFLSF